MFIISLIILLLLTVISTIILSITPLSIGVIILITAILLTLSFSSLLSSWIAFLTFLIYVRGILVIFAYFVSLTPNQKTNNLIMIPASAALVTFILLWQYINIIPVIIHKHIKFTNIFYAQNRIEILILLASILLFTIIVVVKIVTNSKGPLRPFDEYV